MTLRVAGNSNSDIAMRRLLFLCLLLTACTPTNAPSELVALGNVRNTATAEAVIAQATSAPVTQSYLEAEYAKSLTATALPPQQTKEFQEAELRDIAITQAWNDITATAVVRADELAAKVATNNEAARRDSDARIIYNEQQAQKELDAKLTPWFWRFLFWGGVIVSFVIALWIGKAHEKRIRSDADNSKTKAQAEAYNSRLIAEAEARKKRAEARRLEMIPVRGGVYYQDRRGGYEFLPMADAGKVTIPALAPVPPMRGEPIKTYPKVTADVLDFLDACLPLMGDDPRRLPSAEALNNSTLRDNGLDPLKAAGVIHTAGGKGGGTFILGYATVAELRAAVEAGQIPLPDAAEVTAE